MKRTSKPPAVYASAVFVFILLALVVVLGPFDLGFLSGQTLAGSSRFFAATPESLAASNQFTVEELRGLNQVLHDAKFGDNTIILTHLNQAWAANGSMIEMFLRSFHEGIGTEELLDHLVIVALDEPSFQRCVQVHKHCVVLKTEGVDFSGDQKSYMAEDYLKMMWRRIQLLSVVLELGYSFVFTDTDVLWFRDPFPRFHAGADFEIACDRFNGADADLSNPVNGGFLHVVSNSKTISLYKLWYESRLRFPGKHDQHVFDAIKLSPEFGALGLNVRLLGTEYFGGFCEKAKDLDVVCTMHANCCIGLEKKMMNLELVAEGWSLYKLMTPDQRQHFQISWRAPVNCP
ncbi:uncharacterized protein At4g15970 [Selaginella moellendorffii]|uniref:uncharacterized protein At4g15970 n=1 Tax=Selaginella moellendorffii TaxID=88036 RepID=UPI000D1C576B|nr:uncharacterized protein At4g15970 [Selaginella moellendorffii]|eukprot:XP_024519472.1 uncharacterized protein At4g15970 [Selaginella moellendorffii]